MRATVILAAAVAVTLAHAQQDPEQQRPTFRTGANLVRVDATVIDRRGNPVTSLTADDFAVFEDGIPQRIQSFKFVGATGLPVPGDDVSLAIRSPEHAAAEAARDEVRVFLIFWDEYHIGEFDSATRARQALERFVLSELGPTDLVAIMDQLTPLDAIRFTRDRRALADRIHTLRGRLGVYVPPRSAVEEEHLRQRSIENIRALVTASALEGAIIHLGTLREGRKSIIFVSQSFGPLASEVGTVMRALTQAANAHNTAIYPLDPRGLGPRPSGLFQTLAEDTGGHAIVNRNDALAGLRQVVQQASAYYLLGYASGRNPTDGRYHKIDVRLRQPDLEVEARKGYWAPSAADVERARTEAAAAAPPDITAALGTLARSSKDRRLFDMWVGLERLADGQTNVTVAWSPRAASAGPDTPDRATLTATAADGRKYYEGAMPGRHVSFAAPPGPLRLQVAALDTEDAILDRESREVQVPDYRGTALALSVPVVVRIENPRDQRAMLRDTSAPPYAGRDFARTDRVLVRFSVYGDAGATLTVRLMSRAGAPLVTLPAEPFPPSPEASAGHAYQVDLPLSSVARGEYVIEVEAARGEAHAQALVPLRVVQ
jgi:VWFA-related protein